MIICAAAVIAVTIVVFVPRFFSSRRAEVVEPPREAPRAAAAPGNAFVGSRGGWLAPQQGDTGHAAPRENNGGAAPRARSEGTPYSVSIPTLKQVKEEVAAMLPLPSPQAEMLPLPAVADAETTIDASGVRTPEAYVQYFVSHSREVRFDAKRFRAALRNDDGVELLPADLVARALGDGLFAAIRDSLLAWKDFITAKLAFMRGIKVYGEAVAVQKRMLGFDRLTLALIEKALAAERGAAESAELKTFFEKFMATAQHENKEFSRQFQLTALREHGGFFERVLGLFGALPAFAANPPFGVTLGQPLTCECENAYWVPVSGPVAPPNGALFVPKTFLSSPLFFAFKTLRASVWWLGLYTPGVVPCLDYSDECEGVWKEGAPIFMTGASK